MDKFLYASLVVISFISSVITGCSRKQDLIGTYYIANSVLELNKDSTYSFAVNGGMGGYSSNGRWYPKNDTLIFFTKEQVNVDFIELDSIPLAKGETDQISFEGLSEISGFEIFMIRDLHDTLEVPNENVEVNFTTLSFLFLDKETSETLFSEKIKLAPNNGITKFYSVRFNVDNIRIASYFINFELVSKKCGLYDFRTKDCLKRIVK